VAVPAEGGRRMSPRAGTALKTVEKLLPGPTA
jgi:hypothetical protein